MTHLLCVALGFVLALVTAGVVDAWSSWRWSRRRLPAPRVLDLTRYRGRR